MDVVTLDIPEVQSALRTLVHVESWSLVPQGRVEALRAGHHISEVMPADPGWVVESGWLSRSFMSECAKRIERQPETTDLDACNHLLGESAGELAGALRDKLCTRVSDQALSLHYLDCLRSIMTLRQLALAAFPELGDWARSTNSSVKVSPEALARNWRALELLLPPGTLATLERSKPQLLLVRGKLPSLVPLALGLAARVKSVSPGTRVVLQHHRELYSSFAHQQPALEREPGLFDLIDGIIVYSDLSLVTVCDLVDALARTGGFLGVQNLLYRRGATVVFEEPSEAAKQRYLDEAVLGREGLAVAPPAPKTARRVAYVVPANHKCYWDRCHFCATSKAAAIASDPQLVKRGAAAAQKMLELRDDGVETTFLGYELVHPAVVRSIVERLEAEAAPPLWGFEGKLDLWMTPEIIARLARAGCRGLICGLETPNDEINRAMDKHVEGLDVTGIERLIKEFDRHGIFVQTNTIADLPGTTDSIANENRAWLRKMFHGCSFYSFNVNRFSLFHGAKIAADPTRYGIEVLPSEAQTLERWVPFRYLPGKSPAHVDTQEVWRDVFGTTAYRGHSLSTIYEAYEPFLRLLDMKRGTFLLKQIASEAAALQDRIRNGALGVPGSVQMFGVPGGDDHSAETPAWVWFLDPEKGRSARVRGSTWTVLERVLDGGGTLGSALEGARSGPEHLGEILDLVCEGLLQIEDASPSN